MSVPNNIPEGVLKLIIKEMVNEGFEPDTMDSIYEDTSDLDRIDSVLKKFGITGTDLFEYGFYSELLALNYDEKTETIKSPLEIPKRLKVDVWFDVDVRKRITEKYKLTLDTYNTDRSFINDMISAGDLSYYDGEFYDDDVIDSDTDDWNIVSVTVRDLKESRKKKNVITEGRIDFRRFEKEIPKNVLKLILKKLIVEFKKLNIIKEYFEKPYGNNEIFDIIEDVLKIFGITYLNWQEYGFFCKLYTLNENYEDGDEIIIPNLKSFNVTIDEDVVKFASDIWEHSIYSYDKEFVRGQINYDDNFDLYNGHFVRDETHDSETRGTQIIDIEEVPEDKNLTESQKTKKLIKENNRSELIRLQKLKKQIENRIKEITS